MTFTLLQEELCGRLGVAFADIDNNGLFDSTKIKRWLNMAKDRALSYRKWPFLEYAGSDLIDATGKYPYPTLMKTKSAFLVTVAGERYEKVRYEDYLKYFEDYSDGDDKVWAEFDRDIYINGNACSVGEAVIIYGQKGIADLDTGKSGVASATTASHLVDATKSQFVAGDVGKTVWNKIDNTYATVTAYNSTSDLTLDTDIMVSGEDYVLYSGSNETPFAAAEPSGDEAIIKFAQSIALNSETFKNPTKARQEEAGAMEILNAIWDRISEAKPREVLKNTPRFKKINIIRGTREKTDPNDVGRFHY
jgi:hypothetical protein